MSLSASKPVTKTRSPTTIGDELPSGSGIRQRRFSFGPKRTGSPVASVTPEPFGPRNRFHSPASTRLGHSTTASHDSDMLLAPKLEPYSGGERNLALTGIRIVHAEVCAVHRRNRR